MTAAILEPAATHNAARGKNEHSSFAALMLDKRLQEADLPTPAAPEICTTRDCSSP